MAWTAVIIFVVAYIAIASEKFPRHWVALLGGALLILTGVMNFNEAFQYVNWETLGLLSGMFFLVSVLQEAGFFSWLAMNSLKRFNYHPVSLSAILILFAAVMAMFMDSITVMLFLSALTLQLCRLLNLDPVPLIIAEVCAANTGGAATLVGDPPNVILGTTLGFNFVDFITHTGPISALAALTLLGIFYAVNRKALRDAHALITPEKIESIQQEQQEPLHAELTRVGLIGFLSAVTLLVLHLPLSNLTGLPITSAAAALVPALLALVMLPNGQRKQVLLRVDGESMLFFAGLFVLIGGLEKVHVFEAMADIMAQTMTVSQNGLILALHWVPGLASGIVDNVPLALAMSFVLKDLHGLPGMPALSLMVWSLALGIDMGGNLTPI